jgi:DNA repair exonuclease SbcCD ATPase subunit
LGKQLEKLDRVVAAIAQRVTAIDNSTLATSGELKQIQAALQNSIDRLETMKQSNSQVITSLDNMKSLQREINLQLHQMNEKTSMIPAQGGKSH